jgi:hypothetical protein
MYTKKFIVELMHAGIQKHVKDISSVQHEAFDLVSGIDCRGSVRRMCSLDNFKRKLPIAGWLPKYRSVHMDTVQSRNWLPKYRSVYEI